MKLPKATSILLIVVVVLTSLNFCLKYYTYFVLIVSSSKNVNEVIAQETGDVPHPHELYVPLLTFIPSKSPVFTRPWVVLTAAYIQESFVGLIISLLLFFYLGKYLETMWGSKEYVRFILVLSLTLNVLLYLLYSAYCMVYSDFVPPVIMSSVAVNMGLFVAIKQRISNHYFLFFKDNLRVKITYLPFLMLTTYFGLSLLDQDYTVSWQLALIGFAISWCYLRFVKIGTNERQSYLLPFALNRRRSSKNKKFKLKPTRRLSSTDSTSSAESSPKKPGSFSTSLHIDNTSLSGDRSEQFSLYTFFPYPISLLMKVIGQVCFNLLTNYNILNKDDYPQFDEEDDNDFTLSFDDVDNLQSNLFGLSPLSGAQQVSTIPATSKLKSFWNWISSSKAKDPSIKKSMDKRRKLALKELE